MQVTVHGGEMGEQEKQAYIAHVTKQNPGREIAELDIELDGEFVNLNYHFKPVEFDRIRRITGYLVGTTRRFNDAKRAEERDRVRHAV